MFAEHQIPRSVEEGNPSRSQKIKQIKRQDYVRHRHLNYPHLAAIDSLRIIEYTRVAPPTPYTRRTSFDYNGKSGEKSSRCDAVIGPSP